MNDAIVNTRGTLLRVRRDLIEEVPDAGDLPVLQLGSEVVCGTGVRLQARKKGAPKDYKRQRGTVVVVHRLTEEDGTSVEVELGVWLTGSVVAWFVPAELELAEDRKEFPHAS